MTTLIDYSLALEQAGGREELAKELFSMLLNELPDLYAHLHTAWQQRDFSVAQDSAHKILGSTAYCGVPELAWNAKSLEDAFKAGEGDTVVATRVKDLGAAVERLLSQGPALLQQSWR